EVALRRRQLLQWSSMTVEDCGDQLAKRLIADVLFRQAFELSEHHLRAEARALDKISGIEAVGPVGIVNSTDLLDLDLGAIVVVLAVGAADFVELAGAPFIFADLVEAAVGPGHETDSPFRITEAAIIEWFAVARGLLGAFG